MDGLTSRQREIFEFLLEFIGNHGFPPTMREIGDRMGIRSINGVSDHLRALQKKGYIRMQPMKSRTISIVKPSGTYLASGAR